MIISASYKTDIPTFYGDWFMGRVRAGYCKMVNPYNRKVIRVSLRREDVDGIVFWTKNVGPFCKHLPSLHELGFPFIVQHTINAYPKALESSVVDPARAVVHLNEIAVKYGKRVCVWRYDTIVHSSLTPQAFHVENFERLCTQLKDATDEVVVSFVHLYDKTLRNMNRAAKDLHFEWTDPDQATKKKLLEQLIEIAKKHSIQLTICSQPEFLIAGAKEARCIDAERMQEIAGRPIRAELRGNRKECGCFASRDIGEYDTCPHGCVYCYAVRNRHLAQVRYREHDPDSEFLFKPNVIPSSEKVTDSRLSLPLFSEDQ
jgi:hypothetical protein